MDKGVLFNNGVWVNRGVGIPESVIGRLNPALGPKKTRPLPKYKKLSAEELTQRAAAVAARNAIRREMEETIRNSETALKRDQFTTNELWDEYIEELIKEQRKARAAAEIAAAEIRKTQSAERSKAKKSQRRNAQRWVSAQVDGKTVWRLR